MLFSSDRLNQLVESRRLPLLQKPRLHLPHTWVYGKNQDAQLLFFAMIVTHNPQLLDALLNDDACIRLSKSYWLSDYRAIQTILDMHGQEPMDTSEDVIGVDIDCLVKYIDVLNNWKSGSALLSKLGDWVLGLAGDLVCEMQDVCAGRYTLDLCGFEKWVLKRLDDLRSGERFSAQWDMKDAPLFAFALVNVDRFVDEETPVLNGDGLYHVIVARARDGQTAMDTPVFIATQAPNEETNAPTLEADQEFIKQVDAVFGNEPYDWNPTAYDETREEARERIIREFALRLDTHFDTLEALAMADGFVPVQSTGQSNFSFREQAAWFLQRLEGVSWKKLSLEHLGRDDDTKTIRDGVMRFSQLIGEPFPSASNGRPKKIGKSTR